MAVALTGRPRKALLLAMANNGVVTRVTICLKLGNMTDKPRRTLQTPFPDLRRGSAARLPCCA
jgi:hypothetical protein